MGRGEWGGCDGERWDGWDRWVGKGVLEER